MLTFMRHALTTCFSHRKATSMKKPIARLIPEQELQQRVLDMAETIRAAERNLPDTPAVSQAIHQLKFRFQCLHSALYREPVAMEASVVETQIDEAVMQRQQRFLP